MGLKEVSLFLVSVFLTLTLCSALTEKMMYKDKEMIYSYESIIKAGTEIPTSYASEFKIGGKLHVQLDGHTMYFKLTDLYHKIYNGAIEDEDMAKELPLPTEVSDMMTVFKADYDPSGKVKGIYMEKEEKEYIRNMKKAIVAIWQMDATKIFKETDQPHAFMSEEHSIYGYQNVYYNVLPNDDNMTVHKMYELPPVQFWKHSLDTTSYKHSESAFENPISQDSRKTYILSKKDGIYFPSLIETYGAIYYYPYHINSDAQYLIVNQTFRFMTEQPKQTFSMKSEIFMDNLKYNQFIEAKDHIHDLTNGRMNMNWTMTMTFMKNVMEEMWQVLKEDPITIQPPNPENSNLIIKAYSMLIHFDMSKLEELYAMLNKNDNTMKVFLNILPLVGTESSMMFIKKLIMEKKLETEMAIQMLEVIGHNMIMPTRRVIKEYEELLMTDNTNNWRLKKHIILSFGTMLHKCYIDEIKHKNGVKPNTEEMNHLEGRVIKYWEYLGYNHDKDIPNTEFYDNYINMYLTKIKSSNNYEEKMTYMHGLHNMKINSLITLMADGINGKWWPEDKDMRFLSMMVVKPLLQHYPDEVFKMLWPIWTNKNEHKELRMMAFWMIMQSIPSQARLWNMFWYIQDEYDMDLYHFYYTFFKSVAESKEPTRELFRHKISSVMRYMSPPIMGTSTFSIIDFEDLKYTFGSGFKYIYMNSKHTKVWAIEETKQFANTFMENMAGYIKVTGLTDEISEMFSIKTKDSSINIEEFMNMFSNMNKFKADIKVDLVLMKNEKVYYTIHFDKTTMMTAFEMLKKTFNMKDHLYMNLDKFIWIMVPTDMGMPGIFQLFKPIVKKTSLEYKPTMQGSTLKFTVNNHYYHGSHMHHGLGFYNSMLDVWQGVHRFHTLDYMFPMYMTVTFNPVNPNLKISFKTHEDYHKNMIGFRNHVQTVVFATAVHKQNYLTQSSPNAKHFDVVSHGPEFKHNYTILKEDDIFTGYEWQAVVYDTETRVTNSSRMNAWFMLSQPYTKSYKNPWDHFYLTFMNWQTYTTLLPEKAPHGLMIRMVPSTEQKVTSIDFIIRFNEEIKRGKYPLAPQLKYNTRMNYMVKSGENNLRELDLDAMWSYNSGHTKYDMTFDLTYKVPNKKDYKMTVMGMKRYTEEFITGQWNVSAMGDMMLNVQMTNELSKEQKSKHFVYGDCRRYNPYEKHSYYTMECLEAQTSLRKYTYDINTMNVPEILMDKFNLFWEMFKGFNINSFYPTMKENDLNGLTAKVEMIYPMKGREVDVKFYTKNYMYEYGDIPIDKYLSWFGLYPETMFYENYYDNLYMMDLIDHCWVNDEYMMFNDRMWKNKMSNDWTMFIGSGEKNSKRAVFVKADGPNSFYGIKFVYDSEVLEIHQMETGYKFMMNGKEIIMDMDKPLKYEEWISFGILTEDIGSPVIVNMYTMGVHVVLTDDYMWMTAPKMEHKLYGQCYQEKH